MTRLTLVLTAAAVAVLAGCTGETGSPAAQQQQQRVMEKADPDLVLAEAAVILKREFGRVHVDAVNGRITTTPTEYTTQRESGTARDLYRGRSLMRRSATLDVLKRGGMTVARIRVDIERQDTARQTVMQPQAHRLSDTPGQETPIDRDAATTQQQNTVWTKVRRDSALERSILEELRDKIGRLTAEPEPAQPPTEPPASAPAAPEPRP